MDAHFTDDEKRFLEKRIAVAKELTTGGHLVSTADDAPPSSQWAQQEKARNGQASDGKPSNGRHGR